MDVYRPRFERRQVMATRLLLFVVLCGAFASTGWTASHPRIPIWSARDIEGACARALSNARNQVAGLEKLPLSQAAGRVLRAARRQGKVSAGIRVPRVRAFHEQLGERGGAPPL